MFKILSSLFKGEKQTAEQPQPAKPAFSFPKMKTVFKNPEHQAQFERDGYIILPFYTEQEIAELTELYNNIHPKKRRVFFLVLSRRIKIIVRLPMLKYVEFVNVVLKNIAKT